MSFVWALAAAVAVMVVTWAVSVARRDASVADIAWGLAFVAIAAALVVHAPTVSPRLALICALTCAWALRLAGYLAWRAHGRPEDARYAAMRAGHGARFWWVSLGTVFLLQAVLATVIALPLLAVAAGGTARPLGLLDAVGLALFAIGLGFEALADAQLAIWKADPAHAGQVMDQGLWGRSRHPNYFGETVLWWGLGLVGVAAGAWWSLIGPAVITFLLLRVSGVTLLEQTIGSRRPGYADYVRRTPAFLPLGRGGSAPRSAKPHEPPRRASPPH